MNNLCSTCRKPSELCVCGLVKKFSSTIKVLILQHPQEPDHLIGSAWLTAECLENAQLKIGLSWPNLAKCLGESANPSRWGVLYLGSGPKGTPPKNVPLYCVNKKGVPLDAELNESRLQSLEGIIILDGTWSQAKSLWWRNAWLLKLQRLILSPKGSSLYRELRKEPRKECLSTLESVAEVLQALNQSPDAVEHLLGCFKELLNRYRKVSRAINASS